MVDVGANKLFVVPDLWWLARGVVIDSGLGVVFSTWHECKLLGSFGRSGFDFGDDVTPSRLAEVAAQIEHDAPNWRTRVFLCFAKSIVIHFTLSPTMPVFFRKREPREHALRCRDGRHESCWKRIWAWADVHQNQQRQLTY